MDWRPLIGILIAAGLSLIIGLEREYYAKAAGMRTYMLVGMGSALFTVISKYGFADVFSGGNDPDPARVAAQVVTGIGFLGAGLIFVRRDAVRGLTTAAGVWFVAAVGMAAGAGLWIIAAAVTGLYLLTMLGLRSLQERMPHSKATEQTFVIHYLDGHGILRTIMETVSELGLKVLDLRVRGQINADDEVLQVIALTVSGTQNALLGLREEVLALDGVTTVRHFDAPHED